MSVNRRTDAELCLMRLCDESLCGDTAALNARLARLEEGEAPAPRPKEPVRQSAPPQKARQSRPAPPPPPAYDDPPPWDDRPPLPEEAPPERSEMAPPEPPEPEPPVRPAPQRPKPQAKTPAAAPAPVDRGIWGELSEQVKNRLGPRFWYLLDDVSGTLEGDTLILRCGDDFTLENLNSREVSQTIQAASGEYLGRPVNVRILLSGMDAPVEERDKMEELIRAGSKYDCFVVK